MTTPAPAANVQPDAHMGQIMDWIDLDLFKGLEEVFRMTGNVFFSLFPHFWSEWAGTGFILQKNFSHFLLNLTTDSFISASFWPKFSGDEEAGPDSETGTPGDACPDDDTPRRVSTSRQSAQ